PGPVGGGERAAQRLEEPLDLLGGGRAVAAHPVGERAAGQVGHDEGQLVALLEHVEQLDDVGVVEPRQHLRLALDALAGPGDLGRRAVQRQPLERDEAPLRVPGEVDHAHAALAEPGHALVLHRPRLRSAAASGWRPEVVEGGYPRGAMTETQDVMPAAESPKAVDERVIEEAVRLIDGGLADLLYRELVSTDEVSDLLLDVRMVLTAADSERRVDEPVGA